jgi:hypothetical protein
MYKDSVFQYSHPKYIPEFRTRIFPRNGAQYGCQRSNFRKSEANKEGPKNGQVEENRLLLLGCHFPPRPHWCHFTAHFIGWKGVLVLSCFLAAWVAVPVAYVLLHDRFAEKNEWASIGRTAN